MRRARVTYQGAYHHVMNRGYDGKPIFKGRKDKENFLGLLKLYSKKLNIRIFAYCLMLYRVTVLDNLTFLGIRKDRATVHVNLYLSTIIPSCLWL